MTLSERIAKMRPCARCGARLALDPEYCDACVRLLAARGVLIGDRALQDRFIPRSPFTRSALAGTLPPKGLDR